MSKDQTLDDILTGLQGLHPKSIDLSLDRIIRLLAEFENPQDRLPPVVHIAGTNGKGSTLAFMRAILEDAGYLVHRYSSPHLVRFNERITLAGHDITDDFLKEILLRVKRVNAGQPITFFEITTVAAFLAFAEVPADILLLETGLGGRLDTTNVVREPALSVISNIDYDHQKFLGDSLQEIAYEKAGIIKLGIPAVIGPQHKDAMDVLVDHMQTYHASPYCHGDDWKFMPSDSGFSYRGKKWQADLPSPGLPGVHQIENAALAIASLERLSDFTISQDNIVNGLQNVSWPARLQDLPNDRYPEAEIWLDGGHNGAAGRVLAQHLEAWKRQEPTRPIHLIAGMLAHKPVTDFLGPLAQYIDRSIFIDIPNCDASASAADLQKIGCEVGLNDTETAASLDQAIYALAQTGGRILICGSLYLAGHVLEEFSSSLDNAQKIA